MMLAPRLRGALGVSAIAALATFVACSNGDGPARPEAANLSVTGNGLSGVLGSSVAISARITSEDHLPVPSAGVTFHVESGSATIAPANVETDANGNASTTLTFGPDAGEVTVSVSVDGTSLTQTIFVTGIGPIVNCNSSNALTLSVGQVMTPMTGQQACVSGGTSGAEFAVIPFNSNTVYSAIGSINFTSTGANAPSGPPSLAPVAAAGTTLAPVGPDRSLFQPLTGFDARLRALERRDLRKLLPGARAWRTGATTSSALRPSFASIPNPIAVNDKVSLNTNPLTSCSDPQMRGGRVVAITQRAIVIADTLNPPNGFTDAEYQSIGVTFDTLVYDLDVQNFGAPSDIDGNGRIAMFFTSSVNAITPQGSQSIVGGFFFARDLFPKTSTQQFEGCATSNTGEMFYLLVPDPTGSVNSNIRTKTQVSRIVISTTAHEFQHLINASRRMYVNTSAQDFEEVWLNEGLSHVAEELLYYRESSGLTPRMNIDSTLAKSTSKNVAAFNNDQASNFGRYRTYLPRTATSAPYAPDDSLYTRGAIWSFLRYAADHRGTSDGDVWTKLVNSTTQGINNLQNVFGAGVTRSIRDWATSVLTDDLPAGGVNAQFQQPSWNFRSMYATLQQSFNLSTLPLSDANSVSVALNGGGVAFVRFSVAANGFANVQWGVPPSSVAVTLVRTK
jgi:hypothetical protein